MRSRVGRVLRGLLALGYGCVVSGAMAAAGVAPVAMALDGREVDPLARSPGKATVLFFVRPDCPISNRYAPEVRRLKEEFGPDGVEFWLVYPDATLSPGEIRRHIKAFNYPCEALRDVDHNLVELAHARVTPEAAVFSSEGRLVYHGRIDNRYIAFGQWRPEPTRRDLEMAINAVVDGTPVPPGAPAVGCTIPPAQ